MRLQDVMSKDIEIIEENASAEDAWQQMRLQNIHHLIVKRGKDIIGIISERDLGGTSEENIRIGRSVSDFMSTDVITGEATMTVKDAANLMRGNTISCLPVLEHKHLVGIVTISDLLELIGKGLDRTKNQPDRRTVRGLPPYMKPGRNLH
jgi:CBS domain-containing protein